MSYIRVHGHEVPATEAVAIAEGWTPMGAIKEFLFPRDTGVYSHPCSSQNPGALCHAYLRGDGKMQATYCDDTQGCGHFYEKSV
jgi:hypothetical protein